MSSAALGQPQRLHESDPRLDDLQLMEAVALQAALDREGFSPGIIDGLIGPKTCAGLRAYQAYAGHAAPGVLDTATRTRLGMDVRPVLTQYVLTRADAARVGPWPKDWLEKSQAEQLGYESLAALAAERGHCTLRLLEKLNPQRDLEALKPGDVLELPDVLQPRRVGRAVSLEVDFGSKQIRVLDDTRRTVSLFHCSIAADRSNLPRGRCTVATIAMDPTYTFDPAQWPEVRGVDRRLEIPPGPRNPVGLCWIGLSLGGYGIHGTPAPELIGKTGSHGCIRLTNWDALRLAEIVRVGTVVHFVEGPERLARRGLLKAGGTAGAAQ